MVAREVVGVEEEEDAPAGLLPDEGRLLGRRRAREQQRRAAPARRRDTHPALSAAERRVFEQREAEHLGEPGDRLVVLADEEAQLDEGLHDPRSMPDPYEARASAWRAAPWRS